MKNIRILIASLLLMLTPLFLTAQDKPQKGNDVGDIAYEIELPNPEGDTIALSDFRGKLVLVDFWAGWCGPCRRENPNVVKAYKEFNNKDFLNGDGFTVYGVSLDKRKSTWTSAIKKDKLTWPQVSDLKYWQSPNVKKFGIRGIPYNILIDKNGKIIAKNLRGDKLDKTLNKYLKKDPLKEMSKLRVKLEKLAGEMKEHEDYKKYDKEIEKIMKEIEDLNNEISEIKNKAN